MVLRGNAGGGEGIHFCVRGGPQEIDYRRGRPLKGTKWGGLHGFQGERRGLFVSVLQGDYRKLTTEEGNH